MMGIGAPCETNNLESHRIQLSSLEVPKGPEQEKQLAGHSPVDAQ